MTAWTPSPATRSPAQAVARRRARAWGPLPTPAARWGRGTAPRAHHLHEVQQRLLVVLPDRVEGLLRGELHAAQLHRDLKAVAVQVVEVGHACSTVGWGQLSERPSTPAPAGPRAGKLGGAGPIPASQPDRRRQTAPTQGPRGGGPGAPVHRLPYHLCGLLGSKEQVHLQQRSWAHARGHVCPCPSVITDSSVRLPDSPENNLERKVLPPPSLGELSPGGLTAGLAGQTAFGAGLADHRPLRLPSTPSAWEVLSSRSF